MEFVLAIVVLGSLFLNVALAYRLIQVLKAPIEPIIIQMPVEVPKSSEEEKVEVQPEPESVTKKEQPALQAWTNRKNIPWDEFGRPKPEPVRSQTPGPLERPQGFV